MTVQKDVTKNIYVGNGSTRTFPFTFECPAEHPEYIKVYLMQDDGTALATSDYRLDMDAKQITYPSSGTALPEGKKLVIMRELPLQQMMNLVNNGPYFAEDIETAFDECVMAMQQIAEKLNRSIIMSVDIDGDAFVNEVPFEAGKSFRIADDGKSIVLTEDPGKVIDEAKAIKGETETIKSEAETARDTTIANKDITVEAAKEAKQIVDNLQITGESTAQAKKSAETALTSEKNAKASEEAVTTKYDDVTNKHDDVVIKHSNIVMKAQQVTTDADNAKKSADTANGIAAQLTEYLKTKESLTAPAVDKALLIEGAAADSKTTGEEIGKLKEDIGKKLNCKKDYIKQEITVIKNALINCLDGTQYNSSTMENATVSVIPGEQYRIKGWSVNAIYCGLALHNGKNVTRIISNIGAFDIEITIPEGITTMYINGRSADNPISVIKNELINSDSFWLEYDLLVEKTKDTERRVDTLEHKEVNYTVCKYGVNHISDGVIDVFLHKYDDTHDLNIGFKKKSGNNLPDFFIWQVLENASNNVLVDKTGLVVTRTISQGDTDYLSPSTVYAANNGDGDFADFTSRKLTGGWHMYNSKTSGDYTATARNVSCKAYCDGKEILIGEKARGNEIIVDIVNRLQGSNTEKSDGTGREIVEQHFRITFRNGNKVIVDGEITALEDILYASYYGISYFFFTPQRTVPCYLVGDKVTRIGVLPSVSLHRSDANCTAIKTITDTDVFEMGIDTSVDIGDFSNNRGWNMQISSLKAYPMLVMQTEKEKMLSIPKGGKAFWRGYYNCYPTISVN